MELRTLIGSGSRSGLALSNRAVSAYQRFRRPLATRPHVGRTQARFNLTRKMAEVDAELVDRLAERHSVSPAAVQVVMKALRSGGGRMAQFSHADFGGMSQWSPGMTMVGDMFNKQLQMPGPGFVPTAF